MIDILLFIIYIIFISNLFVEIKVYIIKEKYNKFI